MANIDLLQARKTAILTALSNMTPGQGLDLPSAQGGGAIDFVAYRKSLLDELAQINQLIAAEVGPWEVQVKGQT
ncbi:MAG TPA: hypothetical protein VG125_21710 [Pirellulales bacterium]|jgi:hypothetical protein|nr:hypothetical protein [Pirellulales bacterium]